MTPYKTKKLIVIIALAVVPFALLIIYGGGYALYLSSVKGYCSSYAGERSKTSSSPDWDRVVYYDECLEERGIGGY